MCGLVVTPAFVITTVRSLIQVYPFMVTLNHFITHGIHVNNYFMFEEPQQTTLKHVNWGLAYKHSSELQIISQHVLVVIWPNCTSLRVRVTSLVPTELLSQKYLSIHTHEIPLFLYLKNKKFSSIETYPVNMFSNFSHIDSPDWWHTDYVRSFVVISHCTESLWSAQLI